MKSLFEVIGGSVIGRDHRDSYGSNQDAYSIVVYEDAIIAVVADGLGDPNTTIASQFGSRLGAQITPNVLYNVLHHAGLTKPNSDGRKFQSNSGLWERVRQDILSQYRQLALAMGGNLTQTIHSYFMHTLVGLVITHDWAIYFNVGDGDIFCNSERLQLGPFPNNKPPCLAYGVLDPSNKENQIQVPLVIRTAELNSFLLATDGLVHFIANSQTWLPRNKGMIGNVDQFWYDDSYYQNPDALRRRLVLVNEEVTKIVRRQSPEGEIAELDKRRSPLKDDTTIIAGRRKGGSYGTFTLASTLNDK